MDKILDLDKSVASLVKEYPEVVDIMADLGFSEINEYSGAAEPLFRKSGNRLSGIGNRHVA